MRSVEKEDKTGKSKQGENKGHSVSCCHHTSRENGEWGGGVEREGEGETSVVHHLTPGLVVFTLISHLSLSSFAVFSFFFSGLLINEKKQILLNELALVCVKPLNCLKYISRTNV